MAFIKKIDRARQWAGEKMGADKTAQSDEFQRLEAEMTSRQAGTESLQRSAAVYVKWASRQCEAQEDKSRNAPCALLGRSMTSHASDFDAGSTSTFSDCLAHAGRANERVAELHASYVDQVTSGWLDHLDRAVAMMKEYQAARKKLEGRRLAYDTSMARMQKAKRDDFRVEEEMRVCKTKFDDSTEDVLRRMQDIKDAEVDNVAALQSLLDFELAYHERAAEELRSARRLVSGASASMPPPQDDLHVSRTRSGTGRSSHSTNQPAAAADVDDAAPTPQQLAVRRPPGVSVLPAAPPPPRLPRPPVARAATFAARGASAGPRVPAFARNPSDTAASGGGGRGEDVFSDDESVGSDGASTGWGHHSASSNTSHDSVARVAGGSARKKAPPPPPPVNRSTKPPPPPVPVRRANLGC
ncbi:hypothetical protein RJ55_01957 [Drechmeria coniospora]|nr:hypothetical protein RJ55_01957 [Drechmeria coniospora]